MVRKEDDVKKIVVNSIVITSLALIFGCSQDNRHKEMTALNYDSHQHVERKLLEKSREQNSNEFKGLVKEKRLLGDFYQILVHPGHSSGPTYFNVSKKTYEQIAVGEKVVVFEVSDGVVHFSAPPIRYAEEVKVLSE